MPAKNRSDWPRRAANGTCPPTRSSHRRAHEPIRTRAWRGVDRWIKPAFAGASLSLVVLGSGCLQASLATNTGPGGPEVFSAEPKQQAHIGETVTFSLLLIDPLQDRPVSPLDYADYCMVHFGADRVQAEPDFEGRFVFDHNLGDVPPDTELRVDAAVYRQYGNRDFFKMGKQWVRNRSPLDEPDRVLHRDSLTLQIYQSKVALTVPATPAAIDFDSGRLDLHRTDGRVASVLRARADRRGFDVAGPDDNGAYTVTYEPLGNEINQCGHTEARFTVFDSSGQEHKASTVIATP